MHWRFFYVTAFVVYDGTCKNITHSKKCKVGVTMQDVCIKAYLTMKVIL